MHTQASKTGQASSATTNLFNIPRRAQLGIFHRFWWLIALAVVAVGGIS